VSSWTVIELDTTPPDVTWGQETGAVISEELVVPYSTNEPLATARLELTDGRRLTMVIEADRLTITLPDDVPEGFHTIRVADDVGNATTHPIYISGVIPTEPPVVGFQPPTGGGLPEGARAHELELRSRARLRASYATTVVVSSTRTVGLARSRWTIGEPGRDFASRARLAVAWSATTTLPSSTSSVRLSSALSVTKRPEGPGAEDELLLLDIL
jgi:hypothetical protein